MTLKLFSRKLTRTYTDELTTSAIEVVFMNFGN